MNQNYIATQEDVDNFHSHFGTLHDGLIENFACFNTFGENHQPNRFLLRIRTVDSKTRTVDDYGWVNLKIEFEGIEYLAIIKAKNYSVPSVILRSHIGIVGGLPYFETDISHLIESVDQFHLSLSQKSDFVVVGKKCFWTIER